MKLELPAPCDEVAGGQINLLVDGGLGIFHKRADVAADNIGLHGDVALGVLARDLAGTDDLLDRGELVQRHVLPAGRFDQDVADRLGVVPRRLLISHVDVKAADAFKHLPGFGAAHRGADRLLNGGEVDAVARNGSAIRSDQKLRGADHLARLHVGGAVQFTDHGSDLVGACLERVQVVAEELDRQFRFYTAHKFVHVELDRLGEVGHHTGHTFKLFAQRLLDLGLIVVS